MQPLSVAVPRWQEIFWFLNTHEVTGNQDFLYSLCLNISQDYQVK